MGRKFASQRDTYVLPSYYGSSISDSSSDYLTTPTSHTSVSGMASENIDRNARVTSPPTASPTPQGYVGSDGSKSTEGHTAASGGKRGRASYKAQEQPKASLQRSDAVHHGESARENIALANSVSPLDRLVRQADRMQIVANDAPCYLDEQSYGEPARHPEATLPPRGPQRYYPPSSFRMDEDEITEKPNYAPGPPLNQTESRHLRRLSDAERLRKSELKASQILSAGSAAVVPELTHLRSPAQPERGRRNGNGIQRTAAEKLEYPPAAAPKTKHRRSSSLQRMKDVASQAGHGLKSNVQKVSHGLKEGTQKMRHSLQVQAKRLSMDKYKAASVQQPTLPGPSDQGARVQQATRPEAQPRPQRRRASSPPAAAVAAALPPPEQVYSKFTYFTKCEHASPPCSLPLNAQPYLTTLTPHTLRHPTITHKQHLRAQASNVDLKSLKISVIPGRCADCDWAVHRDRETIILDAHKSLYPTSFHRNLKQLQAQLVDAEQQGDERLADRLAHEIATLNLQLRNAVQARDDQVKALWRDFTPRWRIRCVAINGPEMQRAKDVADEEREDRMKRHGNGQCGCTHDDDGHTIRTKRDSHGSVTTASSPGGGYGGGGGSSSRTGFGFMRDTKHGGPIDDVVEEGRMRLSWTMPKTRHQHVVDGAALPSKTLPGGYRELREGEWVGGMAFKNVDVGSDEEEEE